MGLILCIVYVVLISPPRSMFSGCKVDVVPDPELRYAEGANFLRRTRAEISNSKDISRCGAAEAEIPLHPLLETFG